MTRNLLVLKLLIVLIAEVVFAQNRYMEIFKNDGTTETVEVCKIDFIKFVEAPSDADGNTYKIVKIGNQWWMAENLKTTKYNDGSDIPKVTDDRAWTALRSGAFCAYNNDTENESDTYGYLYNWYAVQTEKLAPTGWHIPTRDEWLELKNYLTNNDYSGKEGTALKSTTGWDDEGNGMDNFGFTGIPGGRRNDMGEFTDLGKNANFWSATAQSTYEIWYMYINNEPAYFNPGIYFSFFGLSVRCVRDAE